MYSEDSDMKGCVDGYTKFFQTNEMNVTRIIKMIPGDTDNEDYWHSILSEFETGQEAILINFLSPTQTLTVSTFITTPKVLNITMISFQELSSADVDKFPTTRDADGKYSFYMVSQLLALDITKNTDFVNAYDYITGIRPTPTAAPPVSIEQFTSEEKI